MINNNSPLTDNFKSSKGAKVLAAAALSDAKNMAQVQSLINGLGDIESKKKHFKELVSGRVEEADMSLANRMIQSLEALEAGNKSRIAAIKSKRSDKEEIKGKTKAEPKKINEAATRMQKETSR